MLHHGKVTVKGLGSYFSMQVLYYLDGCVKILSLGWFYFYFYFLYHVFIVKVQELAWSASYGVKKTLIPNIHPLHLFMGEIKHAESRGKVPFA